MLNAEAHIPLAPRTVKPDGHSGPHIVCHPKAAYKLECFYDRRIPRDELDRAYAIDDEFRDEHPEWLEMTENARYAREARAYTHCLIVALRARGGTAGRLSERDAESIRITRGIFRTHHRLALMEAANKRSST